MSRIERPTDRSFGGGEGEIALRPIERCVLNALEGGSGYPEIAARLRRTPQYVSRIEEFANLKRNMAGS